MNIESLRNLEQQGLVGSLGFRLSGTTGNTDKLMGSVSTTNGYLSEKREVLVLASYRYGQSRGEKDTNTGSVHLRHTRHYKDIPDIEVFTQWQFDEFAKLNSRPLAGAGLRESLIKTQNQFLYLGLGAFYERQDREDSPDKNATRINSYLSYLNRVNKNVEASVVLYYQPDASKTQDARVNADAGFEFALSSKTTFSSSLNLSYDSRPPEGVTTTDVTYFSGLHFRY
jgi:hypothetical protein